MKKIRVYLDMDEVLSDFVGTAARAWGVHPSDHLDAWLRHNPGDWDMVPALSLARGTGPTGITPEQFWSRVNGSEQFWATMPKTRHYDEVMDLVRSVTDDWWVVTSPSRCPTCYSGKVKWLQRQFGAGFDRFHLTRHKAEFARPNAVLIDDKQANVDAFVAAGGHGVTFPHAANPLHALHATPLDHVRPTLLFLVESLMRKE